MHDRTADEQTDDNEQRHQDNKYSGADAQARHRGDSVVLISEKADGLQTQREQKRDDGSCTSADERINEWLA